MQEYLPSDRLAESPQAAHRFEYLDGLRGIASVAVFLWHNFLAFFPGSVSPDVPMRSRLLEETLYRSPLAIFFAGDFSVLVFFIISGFVVSYKHLLVEDTDALKKSFLRRYIRLLPPAFVTIFFSYLLLRNNLIFSKPAGALLDSWWLKLNWSEVNVSFTHMLWTGLYGIWFEPSGTGASFNSNLGTLAIELIGSFIIYITIISMQLMKLSFAQRCKLHIGLIAITAGLTIDDPHYVVFFIGMFFADIYVQRPNFFRIPLWASWLILITSVFFGAMNIGNIRFIYYKPIEQFFRFLHLHPLSNPWAIGAVLLMYGTLANPVIQKILSANWARFLGRYSFALFVTHTVFLGSATCFAFITLQHYWNTDYRILIGTAFFMTLPVLMFITYLIQIIDAKSIRLSKLF